MFSFEGRAMAGLEGDTVASALLANGERVLGVGPRGRPLGILDDTPFDPGMVVTAEGAPLAVGRPLCEGVALARAPRPRPSGPRALGLGGRLGTALRRFGQRPAPAEGVPVSPHEHAHLHTDVLVIGAGPAGLMAALEAARAGARVVLSEAQRDVGGWLTAVPSTTRLDALAPDAFIARTLGSLRQLEARLLLGAVAIEGATEGVVTLAEPMGAAATLTRLWHVHAREVILATGLAERMLAFRGNDRPGVMRASAVARFARRFGVRAGTEAVLITSGGPADDVAATMAEAGIAVVATVDVAAPRERVMRVVGRQGVEGVEIAAAGRARLVRCDLVAVAGGVVPRTIPGPGSGEERGGWRRVGGAAGVLDLAEALEAGAAAGRAAASGDGVARRISVAGAGRCAAGPEPAIVARADVFLDTRRTLTAADIRRARDPAAILAAAGPGEKGLIAAALGGRAASLLAEAERRQAMPLAEPAVAPVVTRVRRSPVHAAHREAGAVFEHHHGWARPVAFPHAGEGPADAACREALAAREAAALFDASGLGRVLAAGPSLADALRRLSGSTEPVDPAVHRLLPAIGEDGCVLDALQLVPAGEGVHLVGRGPADAVIARLIAIDPELLVADITDVATPFVLHGPQSAVVLDAVLDAPLVEGVRSVGRARATLGGVDVHITPERELGGAGFRIDVPTPFAAAAWVRLANAAWSAGGSIAGWGAARILGVEAGRAPLAAATAAKASAAELGLGLLSSDVRRLLVGLEPLGAAAPSVGARLVATRRRAQKTVALGEVIASERSLFLRRGVALALMTRGAARMGDVLYAVDGRSTTAVRVGPPSALTG
ncbi:FAD-dependent oxidoreductase [Acuticoccus mangrovi]|uniref:FAD-dependent oxidoreductase n=1 Tax=Acuticoccus mangrovi TaxID=2796142 RepID=A0A934IFU4_9HYPH|nr:FAD-dependent oxidoreductase [Acuticoccus mangrovi]MBJ3775713.1 FAD-dependent oxidoreductase [Acuticoccus mangrovi]